MRENRYGYVIVASVFVVMMIIWGAFATFGVFFESFIKTFGWTRAMTSGASSIRDLAFGVACILTARLSDRFGPRIVVSICGLLLGVGYGLMSRIATPWELYIYYGVVVACGMSAYITLLSIVARWFDRRRGMMTAVVFSGMGIGSMVMPPVVHQFISIYGWRHSYMIIAVIGSALMVIAAQCLKRSPLTEAPSVYADHSDGGHAHNPQPGGLSLRNALGTMPFWVLSTLYFSFLYSLLSISVHVVIHCTGIGIPSSTAANLLAIIGGLCVVGMNLAGSAADRIGNRRTLSISFLLMTIALADLVASRGAWHLFVFAALFGLAYGGMQVLFSPLVAELFGLASHGVILGAAAFVGSLGAALGPFMSGYIFDATQSYQKAFLICIVMAVAGIFLPLLLRPVQREAPRKSVAR
jgi:MFS family permease